LKTEY